MDNIDRETSCEAVNDAFLFDTKVKILQSKPVTVKCVESLSVYPPKKGKNWKHIVCIE